MTDSTINPAMPPEEWAAQLDRSPENRREKLGWAVDEADADGHLTIHGLAALCLYGQPFGFTQGDVDNLRGILAGESWAVARAEIANLAERIAALLPRDEHG